MSIGNGNTIVEFFSADIVFSVCMRMKEKKNRIEENETNVEKIFIHVVNYVNIEHVIKCKKNNGIQISK